MNTFSHLQVGKFLYRHLLEQHGIKLDLTSFLYGNLVPDFKPFYKSLPHEPVSWERFIQNEIAVLSEHKQVSLCFGSSYSRRLGVICHFYADFFCFPHTKAYQGGDLQHLKYEWDLYRYSKKNPDIFKTGLNAQPETDRSPKGIYGHYRDMHATYLGAGLSFGNDMASTLQACALTIIMITSNSIVRPELARRKLLTGGANS